MNAEEIIDRLYPLIYKYNQEGSLFGRDLMNYIHLIGKLKKLDSQLAQGYILENNAVNLNPGMCAICLENINKSENYCKNKNCSHCFHWNCSGHSSIKTCPMCRAPFVQKLVQNERVYFGKTSDLRYLQRL
jgi:hypothetical protein